MEKEILELQNKIEDLTAENLDLREFKQEYNSAKQSLNRMSVRLRKLCKKLECTNDILIEMQGIAYDIRELAKAATSSKESVEEVEADD